MFFSFKNILLCLAGFAVAGVSATPVCLYRAETADAFDQLQASVDGLPTALAGLCVNPWSNIPSSLVNDTDLLPITSALSSISSSQTSSFLFISTSVTALSTDLTTLSTNVDEISTDLSRLEDDLFNPMASIVSTIQSVQANHTATLNTMNAKLDQILLILSDWNTCPP